MSRTDKTRPWKIREEDPTDAWRHLPYRKKYGHCCEFCMNVRRNKVRNSKRGAIKDQLDNPADDLLQ
jgi:hypothetical protein